jgi:(p)ppGpp synthase/HD superfamily hydrolase
MADLIGYAYYFASAAHGAVGQKRKYTGEDYIVHPVDVADILRFNNDGEFGGRFEDVICAAYLHDTIEDTAVRWSTLLRYFNPNIANLVLELTNESKGNRKERKKKDLAKTAGISFEAKMIRLADIHSNCRSIFEHDKKFAKIYIQEKVDMLEVMNECRHTSLFKLVENRLNDMIRELYLT